MTQEQLELLAGLIKELYMEDDNAEAAEEFETDERGICQEFHQIRFDYSTPEFASFYSKVHSFVQLSGLEEGFWITVDRYTNHST